MASTGVNVLRWGALVFGVFYGFSHQSAISSSDKKIAAQNEWDRKQRLIQQAKAEYVKKTKPATGNDGVIEDSSDPKFDLGAYMAKYAN